MTGPVKLLQLYPNELGVAGDRGNVMAITARLNRAGVQTSVVQHTAGDALPNDVDLVVVGSGPVSAIRNIHADLLSNAGALRSLSDAGVPFFAYGAGAELLGRSIRLLDGAELAGVRLFPFTTVRIERHRVGYTIVDSEFGQLAGFEDNASLWHLDAGAHPLGRLVAGNGNSDSKQEGVRVANSVATQVGGPILPLNPALTDAIIRSVVDRLGIDYVVGAAHADLDHYALKAREVIVDHADHVFSRI
ncbi:type 1 glutamine amidotransferase [Parafrigoribacterium humi]|jgi:CobQ-like glutamine amidotransferase family enzyme|uniref:type 1 glutamine amidotransferase n=1 Tax=Parafrigoribacterium humi TaxID=3144664 RepID=UPI0032ECA14E